MLQLGKVSIKLGAANGGGCVIRVGHMCHQIIQQGYLYLFGLMSVVVGILWWPRRRTTTPFHWTWAIPLISFFLVLADFAYFYALHQPDAMVSVVSMVRRSSVVVSFLCGAVLFREHNLRSKAFDLAFILVGMFFLWLGSR